MILVAGGTGTLGTRVVRWLTERGEAVRVLARDPAAVAAAAAGVQHLVLVSVLDAGPDHPMSLHRAKYAAEQALRDSGLAWTIIRPAAYLETWVGIVGAKLARNGQALVFGPGRNPIAFVSADDVAAVVDLAVHDPTLRGQVLEVADPEQLSFTQLADRLVAASGRPGRVRHLPLPVLRTTDHVAAGPPGGPGARPPGPGRGGDEHHRHDRRPRRLPGPAPDRPRDDP